MASQKLERHFQADLVKELKNLFKGCLVLKTDPNYIQGFPDILILYKKRWAALECKRGATSNKQPNQEYYVNAMNNMSFSRFISPENKEEVLRDLQQTLKPSRRTCLSGGE